MQTFNMYFVIFCVLSYFALVQGKCNGGCDIPLTHYEEFGCVAKYAHKSDCCPSYYDCASVEGRNANKCYYKGHVYNEGDKVNSTLTAQNCLVGCFCSGQKFTCAHIDCPEFFGATIGPGCYRAYSHDQCCSTKTVCPPFDNLAKCVVNDKTYYEGQRFEAPSNPLLNCICLPNFEGKFKAPFCTPINCGIELLKSDSLKTKCAPVYYGSKGVCPIQWECEESVESIQIANDKSHIKKKCAFGSKELNVGDKLILKRAYESSPEINCECRIPPIVTCIQTPHGV